MEDGAFLGGGKHKAECDASQVFARATRIVSSTTSICNYGCAMCRDHPKFLYTCPRKRERNNLIGGRVDRRVASFVYVSREGREKGSLLREGEPAKPHLAGCF
jgi:hypothetical protein